MISLRRLKLEDMDRAAAVHRVSFDHAFTHPGTTSHARKGIGVSSESASANADSDDVAQAYGPTPGSASGPRDS
jgi:hypothetical protein